jgi:hypothetical protein
VPRVCFGVKAQLQFGKTTVIQESVFWNKNHKTKRVVAEGGGTIQDFEMFGLRL